MIAKSEVKELDELQREVTVELKAEEYNDSMESKFSELQKEAVVEGFRKGKVPLNLIKSKYLETVKDEVVNDLIKKSYSEIVREKGLKVASYPMITSVDLADDGTFTYKAKVEVFPELEKVEFEGLEILEAEVTVEDNEVEEYLEQVRKHHADVREVQREATDQDIILVDLEKLEDSKMVLKEDKFPDSSIDLSNPATIKEFREEMPGMKAGDEKEIAVKYADDYPDANFSGAEIKYKCTVKTVSERILPELTDSFAVMTGVAQTALELKIKLRSDIERQKTESLQKQQKGMLIGQMCEKNKIAVPKASLKEYLDNVVEEFKKQGGEFDEEAVRNQYQSVGVNTFRWNMIYHTLSEQEKIEVSASDTENLINRFAENYKTTPEEAKKALQKSGKIADLRESILEEKVLEFLVSKAKAVKGK